MANLGFGRCFVKTMISSSGTRWRFVGKTVTELDELADKMPCEPTMWGAAGVGGGAGDTVLG